MITPLVSILPRTYGGHIICVNAHIATTMARDLREHEKPTAVNVLNIEPDVQNQMLI